MKQYLKSIIVCAALAVATTSASGATALISDPGTGNPTTGGVTVGYSFTVGAKDLTVYSLGLWDQNSDGLASSHDVGIWDNTGSPVAIVTVPAGTAGSLVGEFRYQDLTPVDLSAGVRYTIGALYYDTPGDDDTYRANTGNVETGGETIGLWSGSFWYYNPALDADDAAYNFNHQWGAGVSLTWPTGGSSQGQAYVGPNFTYVMVPEPCSVLLLGAGTLLLSRRRQRR